MSVVKLSFSLKIIGICPHRYLIKILSSVDELDYCLYSKPYKPNPGAICSGFILFDSADGKVAFELCILVANWDPAFSGFVLLSYTPRKLCL